LIRKEHVDVAMEFSRCARAHSARPSREPRPSRGSVLQNSTACEPRPPDGDRD
jgi:hypothetical protein